MSLGLHTLKPAKGATQKRWVVGRGHGTGIGKTSGRGMKGQTARSGVSGLRLKGFRHLMLSTPKARGFTSGYDKPITITLGELSFASKPGDKVNLDSLRDAKLITRGTREVKIVSGGKLRGAFHLKGIKTTVTAKKAIEEAGGSVSFRAPKAPKAKKLRK